MKNIKTNISICTQGNAVNDHEGESVIEVNIESRIFDMSITQMGKFRKNGTVSIRQITLKVFWLHRGSGYYGLLLGKMSMKFHVK